MISDKYLFEECGEMNLYIYDIGCCWHVLDANNEVFMLDVKLFHLHCSLHSLDETCPLQSFCDLAFETYDKKMHKRIILIVN